MNSITFEIPATYNDEYSEGPDTASVTLTAEDCRNILETRDFIKSHEHACCVTGDIGMIEWYRKEEVDEDEYVVDIDSYHIEIRESYIYWKGYCEDSLDDIPKECDSSEIFMDVICDLLKIFEADAKDLPTIIGQFKNDICKQALTKRLAEGE